MSIQDLQAVIYLGIDVSLVFLIKRVLDSELVLEKHPYFKNPWLRVCLVFTVASPLGLVLAPDYSDIAHVLFAGGLMGSFTTVGFIYNTHVLKIAIKLTNLPAGQVVSAVKYLSFYSDRYTEISPGVFVRRVLSKEDVLPGLQERKLQHLLNDFDFDKEVVLVVRFGEGAEFPEHAHPGYERYYMVEGEAEMMPLVIVRDQTHFRIEAGDSHYFKGIRAGMLLVGLELK